MTAADAFAVGTAVATEPGTLAYGHLDLLDDPLGGALGAPSERLPVVVARGATARPCLWITANIHGGEVTGIYAVHEALDRFVRPALATGRLLGTVVAVPTLSPAGLRTLAREPYYDRRDPNRLFPDARPEKVTGAAAEGRRRTPLDDEKRFPGPREVLSERLYEAIAATATHYVDLHTALLLSIPFTFVDRILVAPGGGPPHPDPLPEGRGSSEAHDLAARTLAFARAVGLPIVRERPAWKYVKDDLHRSTTGAVLNKGRIPALTLELGLTGAPDPVGVEAGAAALARALAFAGVVLPGAAETTVGATAGAAAGAAVPGGDDARPLRYCPHPRAPAAGLVRSLVRPGDVVRAGDPVAELRDIYGRRLGDGPVRSEVDGLVLFLPQGALVHANTPLAWLAVPDDEPLVSPWPE